MKFFFALACVSSLAAAQSVTCITVETMLRSQLHNGVNRSDIFRDQHCFDDNNIWIKRLGTRSSESTHHHELNIENAVQWYKRTPSGAQVELLDEAQAIRVPLQNGEWDVIGFDGDFEKLRQRQSALSTANTKVIQQQKLQAPWQAIQSWRQREYSDFSD